jgi:hypothetical protein
VNTDRRVKSCGKDGQRTPLEIASRFPLFAQLQQQQVTIVITFWKIHPPASLRSDD